MKNNNGTSKSHHSSTNGIYRGQVHSLKKIKLDIKNEKQNTCKHIMEHLKDNMSEKSKRLLQLSTEKGVSNWLTMLPIAEYGFELSNQQF